MKRDVPPRSENEQAYGRQSGWASDFAVLVKARLSLLVVFTTAIGFHVGAGGLKPLSGFLSAVLGTALAAGSAAALNQWMESDVDQLMERTRNRPLAAGRWGRTSGLWVGIALGVAGVGVIWATLPRLAACLAAANILVYLAFYTPMKRRSWWCVLVGAVSGALPPVIGWAATGSTEKWAAWVLFGILFFWQMPHFLAIAWMYSEEYQKAGFVMLKPGDEAGFATALQALVYAVLLAAVTFVPVFLGKTAVFYSFAAGLLNLMFCGSALVFFVERSRVSARRLFFMSIIFLPVLLGLLAFSQRP